MCRECHDAIDPDSPWTPPSLPPDATSSPPEASDFALRDSTGNALTMGRVVLAHRTLERAHAATVDQYYDSDAEAAGQWLDHPATSDDIWYSQLDVDLSPGNVCPVCWASSCGLCGFVFDDVSHASSARAPDMRRLCFACAWEGANGPAPGAVAALAQAAAGLAQDIVDLAEG